MTRVNSHYRLLVAQKRIEWLRSLDSGTYRDIALSFAGSVSLMNMHSMAVLIVY